MRWPIVPLGQLCELGPQYGANAKAVGSTGSGTRYVRITDIDEFGQLRPDSYAEAEGVDLNQYQLNDGDIVVARSGATVGKSYRHVERSGPCIFAGYLIRFGLNSAVADSRYVAYFLQSDGYQSWVQSKKRVAAQPNINGTEYASLGIPLPSLSEQRRIVAILEEADRLRTLSRQADERADRILPALFQRMFGIPESWGRGSAIDTLALGHLVNIQSGGTPSKAVEEYWEGDIPWVSPKDMKRDFISDAEDHISEEAIQRSATRLIEANSVLVVVRGMILARYVPVAMTACPVSINQDIKALTVTDSRISPLFLFAAMKTAAHRLFADVSTAAHGTKKLDTSRLEAIPIPIPSRDQVDLFTKMYEQVLSIDRNRHTAAPRIAELFSLLVERAFTGELTSKWREANMNELLVEMAAQARLLNLPSPESLAS